VAAVGSYLCARQAGGDWLVRIEDLDPPREVPGSADLIVATLDQLGFQWNESIARQSLRTELYQAAIERLTADGLAYPCSCSRSELQAAQPPGRAEDDELYYPGWCRTGVRAPERGTALRFKVPDRRIHCIDELQGDCSIDLSKTTGDFVIRRRDGLHAYQLAVVVDDADQAITHVVRGVDLLTSTPRQIALQAALGLPSLMYAHLPLVTDGNGVKLSKSTGAAAIDTARPSRELWRALTFLRQSPPTELSRANVQDLWEWAIEHWHVHSLHGMRQARIDDPP
jgi:glutamyl-Q tRNA(Asp) synthetase